MHVYDEMKSWVGFGPADEARLRELQGFVAVELDRITDQFYSRILANPEAARVITSEAQIARLKGTLKTWAIELLEGPHDLVYFDKRQRIGRRHVEVGLPSRYMYLAMNGMRAEFCRIAHAHFADAHAHCEAVGKVMDLDLAIMSGTYVREREALQLANLQEVLVAHLPVSVLVADASGRVVAMTAAARDLLAADIRPGRRWDEALPTALREDPHLQAAVRGLLDREPGHPAAPVEVRVQAEGRTLHANVLPLDHAQARVLIHVDDLTETLLSEARTRKAEALAQIGALSAAVAHELRNPLAGISGAIQVIARSMPTDDRRKPIMDKVEQQVRRLDALVSDLLAFARTTEPDLRETDLVEIARVVADLVHREYAEARIVVEGTGRARADANLTQQILLNLVQNAVQAQDGRGLVVVSVSSDRIDVSDDGGGVPEDVQPRIFDPFFTTRARGTGLGLAICRKLATAMGGDVTLVPGRLKGACFRLSLVAA